MLSVASQPSENNKIVAGMLSFQANILFSVK
jgi:hypothetical protein